MKEILPEILCAVVTDVMLVLLLCTVARPKYKSKWIYILAAAVILTGNISANIYLFLKQDYESIFLMDLLMLLIIGVVLKLLFSDRFVQWCFSFITMLNLYAAVVLLSYILSSSFPYPRYAVVVLRFVLFGGIILTIRSSFVPLYQRASDSWYIYFLPTFILFLNFCIYYAGGNLEETLSVYALPILLLIALGSAIYIAIFHSLNAVRRQYDMREENLKLQNTEQLLRQSSHAMEQRLALMDQSARQMSIVNHDRKHFNNTLLELLQQGKIQDAITMLTRQQTFSTGAAQTVYCQNPAVNAAIVYYVGLAKRESIDCDIHVKIPAKPVVDSLELSMVISNLMENAVNACTTLPPTSKRYLRMAVLCEEQLIIEVENPYEKTVTLDHQGYPTSDRHEHGIGTKSVLAFVERHCGDIVYETEGGIFNVRLLV